jgi:hypothetical protein
MRAIAIVAIVGVSGCAYQHTAGRRTVDEMGNVYDAHGWDSGLAYGLATKQARADGWDEEPDAVDMDCFWYGLKPAIAVVAGGIAGVLISKRHEGAGVVVGALALPLWFWPNCHATIGYLPRRAAPRPAAPAVAPPASSEPADPPVRALHPQAPEPPAPPAQVPPAE